MPWEFERAGEALRLDPSGPLTATVIDLELEAALAGLGIISSFEGFLAPALAAGTLVPLLEDWWLSFSGPFLYYADRRHMPAPLRAFVNFIKAESGA